MLEFEDGKEKFYYFVGGLIFPVFVIAHSEEERQKLSYAKDHYKSGVHTTKSLCQWCIRHKIEYHMIFQLTIGRILRHPYKCMRYLQLKKELGYSI